MTTHKIPIIDWSAQPDATGECWFEPFSILATNDVWKHTIVRFGSNNAAAPTVRHGFYGTFDVPENYVGSPVLVIDWSSTLTTNDIVWDFEYRAVGGNDTESLDQAGTQESVTVTDTAPSAALERQEVTIALTAGNFAAGDTVEYYFARDGADAADTLAGSGIGVRLKFQYADA